MKEKKIINKKLNNKKIDNVSESAENTGETLNEIDSPLSATVGGKVDLSDNECNNDEIKAKRKAENKKSIIRLVVSVAVIGAILGLLYLVFHLLGWTDFTKEEIQAFIQSTGAIAPLVFILVSFVQVTLVPIPGAVTILAGVYLFGALESFIYSYIGMMLGAIFAFFLGRIIGRPYVNWVAGSKEKADEWIKKLKGRETVFLFFAFFLPFFPDDILCSVAGVLPIRWGAFIIMQIITRATSIGGTMLFMSGEVIPYHGWGLVVLGLVLVICVVAFIISLKYAEEINSFFDRFIDKIVGKSKNKSTKKQPVKNAEVVENDSKDLENISKDLKKDRDIT